MSLKDKDIERIFRDNQHGFDKSPSPKTWTTLKERLQNHNFEKNKNLYNMASADSLERKKILPNPVYLSCKNTLNKQNRVWLKYAAILLLMCIPLSIFYIYVSNNQNHKLEISENLVRPSDKIKLHSNEKESIGILDTKMAEEEEEFEEIEAKITQAQRVDKKRSLSVPSIPSKRFLDSRYYTISKKQFEDKSIYNPKKQNFAFGTQSKAETISLKEDISWLLHTWKVEIDDATLLEEWTMFDENSFRGKAFTFKDSKVVYGEDLILIKEGKSIFYHVLDQKTSTGATYQLQNSSDKHLVFEQIKAPKVTSPETYPKTITYTLLKNNILSIYFGKLPYRNVIIYPVISLLLQ